MGTKQKVSANGTYVFDPDEIEQLDELTFTSILPTIADDGGPQPGSESESPEVVAPGAVGNTTINELLSYQLEPDAEPPPRSDLPGRVQAAEEPSDDLLDPGVMFPELPTKKDKNER
jgi:hypothetical protein